MKISHSLHDLFLKFPANYNTERTSLTGRRTDRQRYGIMHYYHAGINVYLYGAVRIPVDILDKLISFVVVMVTKNKMENERKMCRLMEGEAKDYIKLHKISELFKNMTALLLYHQPGKMGMSTQRALRKNNKL